MQVIFFDIGDTLAAPIFDNDDRLKEFVVFPEVRGALDSLKERNYRMGIISNAGDESPERVNAILEECGIFEYFDSEIIIYRKKDSAQVFTDAAQKAGVPPSQCVFVGENSGERAFAVDAGYLRVAPHPSLVLDVIEGNSLVYLRVTLDQTADAEKLLAINETNSFVPLRVSGGDNQKNIYLIASLKTLDAIYANELQCQVLGGRDAPLQTDFYLVRDDRAAPPNAVAPFAASTGFLAEEGQAELILDASDDGVYLAMPANRSIEEIHFPAALHGHNEKLTADTSLLNSLKGASAPADSFAGADAFLVPSLTEEELNELARLDGEMLRAYHEPFAGLAPLDGAAPIISRHIRHSGNRTTVEALRRKFAEIGGADISVGQHRFQHEDLFLYNVFAEIPGTETDSFVFVTAHLDSTASNNQTPYNPAVDEAKGADDDASGIAAVLAVAEVFVRLHRIRRFKKTIRFVLFNAEEHGLVGSKAYARAQAAAQTDIAAVFQMDMVGYRKADGALRKFEVHAGFPPSIEVEDNSLRLARVLRNVFQTAAPQLDELEIYPDRELGVGDPAAGRSDHAPFQERGYSACVVSENFFVGPKPDAPAENNPAYHTKDDTKIDNRYAADIARAVAAAAILAANS